MSAPNFPKMEEDVLREWEEKEIFKKTSEKPSPKGDFVFFEGPPTANGRPGIHHIEARAFKDLIPRFRTMRGFHVERKAGWDTHGLPVELGVEKALGISGKRQIESLKATPEESIAFFNKECKKSVWSYQEEWERMTTRIGFWLDLKNPYITYETPYIESLWWIMKEIWNKGLLEKDYKVVPYCPRCGTALSSHEVAQGYQEVTEESVTARFRVLEGQVLRGSDGKQEVVKPDTFFLVWTTTPWTLPANVALAVGGEIPYVVARGEEGGKEMTYILAEALAVSILPEGFIVERTLLGKELADLSYEPLYNFLTPEKPAHRVITGDFVSTEDGTGIVHIAPAFGEDDLRVSRENELPMLMTADAEGRFLPEVTPWAGMLVKEADPKIIEELRSRGALFRSEPYTHEYPFCWRCSTPLLYYAKESWWIRMTELRGKLLAANNEINWIPGHLKEGRFGEWLRGVKDWAFSRERYWGTPLPIWECDCGERSVIGGLDEFPESPSRNTYYFLRHGEADSNVKNITMTEIGGDSHLTEKGKKQIKDAAKKLGKENIDLMLASDFPRTRETAEIVEETLGTPVAYDARLREISVGEYDGLAIPEFHAKFPGGELERFDRAPKDGESLTDVLRRQTALIRELEEKHQGKRILLIGHGDPLWVLEGALRGMTARQIIAWGEEHYIKNGEIRSLTLKNLPRDPDGFVDLHRPYIDEVKLHCGKCGSWMSRVKEVADVWFDSGAMPIAQWHYPFENKEKIDKGEAFPADYISEAIDQTRGWFYTLLAVSVLQGRDAPYKNVISVGHLLDAKGRKMSKSKGNVVDPWSMIEKYGADAIRLYMYSVNQPGDVKRFDEKDLSELQRRFFLILWNVLTFYKTYTAENPKSEIRNPKSNHVLDRWIVARLGSLTDLVTKNLDVYEVTESARALMDFATDLSTWYVRRSRDRFKSEGKEAATQTLGYVLLTLSKLLAPFLPFTAEALYRDLGGSLESVHLEEWPEEKGQDEKLLAEMKGVRDAVSLGLEQRAAHKIAIRQPLAKATVQGFSMNKELLPLIAEELNVQEVKVEKGGAAAVVLDTEITPELKAAGALREMIRHVQSLRKTAGLSVGDTISLAYETSSDLAKTLGAVEAELAKAVRASSVKAGKTSAAHAEEVEVHGTKVWVGIEKI